mgnify:CR=1 FL=1
MAARYHDAVTAGAENLIGPTAVAVLGDRIFVSEEFAGRVVEIRAIDQPPLSAEGRALAVAAAIAATVLAGGALLVIQQRSQRQEILG